jgi:hypothetical protein
MNDSEEQVSGDWRQIFGALANEETRRFYAQQVLGLESDLRPERVAKADANLRKARLIDNDGVPDHGIFARLLAHGARTEPRVGQQRFFDAQGRLDRYPKNHEERVSLLRLISGRVMGHGEHLTEAELTVKLGEIADDPVLLRRYLVDYGVVLRQPDGSSYRLADGSD